MHHTFHCADAIFWHIDMAKSQQHDETQQPRWLRYVSRPCFFFRVERKRLQITRKWLHPTLANQATKFGNKKTKVGSDPQSLWQNRGGFGGKRSFFDLLKDRNPWELCHWELVAATGLNGRRRKPGLNCLKTMLPDFRYAGIMIRYQTIESIEWVFFQKQQPAVNELKAFKKQKQGDNSQINLISTIANNFPCLGCLGFVSLQPHSSMLRRPWWGECLITKRSGEARFNGIPLPTHQPFIWFMCPVFGCWKGKPFWLHVQWISMISQYPKMHVNYHHMNKLSVELLVEGRVSFSTCGCNPWFNTSAKVVLA